MSDGEKRRLELNILFVSLVIRLKSGGYTPLSQSISVLFNFSLKDEEAAVQRCGFSIWCYSVIGR